MADTEPSFWENYKTDMKASTDNGGAIASRLTLMACGWIAGASMGFARGRSNVDGARLALGPVVLIP